MACILTYNGKRPRLGPGVFVAPNACLIGDVELAEGASVWFGAVLRGDEAGIRIGAHTSVQDNAVIHVYEGHDTIVEDHVTIGHGAILEACRICKGALIGMNAVILERAVIGQQSLVAAGSVVLEGQQIPPGMLAAGAPARVKRALEGRSKEWLEVGAQAYMKLAKAYREQELMERS